MTQNTSSPSGLGASCLVVAFLTGGVTLITELLAAGWMAPAFGSGIDTWSAILGTTLFSLALGYFVGSWSSKKVESHHLPYLLALSGAFLLGCALIFRSAVGGGAKSSILLWALLLLGPPLFLLAMVSPWLVQFYAKTGKEAGESAGLTYGISTLGGVAGALGTGFWMIPRWGLFKTLIFCGWMLVVAIFNWSVVGKKSRFSCLLCAAILSALLLLAYFFAPPARPSLATTAKFQLIWQEDSWYGRREVYEDAQQRHLLVNGILQTRQAKGGIQSFPRGSLLKSGYVMELLPYFYPQGKNGLVIGLGGGLLSSFLTKYNLKIDSVELDPRVLFLARKYFNFLGNCTIQDGRQFLNQSSKIYSFVILDVYRGETIPPHLTTREFFLLIKKHLQPEGVVALNLIGSIKGEDTGSILKTIQSVFPNLLLYPPYGNAKIGILTVFARSTPLDHSKLANQFRAQAIILPSPVPLEQYPFSQCQLLTDDTNPLSLLRRKTAWLWRKTLRDQYAVFAGH